MTKLGIKRKDAGITQADLANAAGINLRTLQDYEQGRKNINKAAVITVVALAKALNCSIEDIIE